MLDVTFYWDEIFEKTMDLVIITTFTSKTPKDEELLTSLSEYAFEA